MQTWEQWKLRAENAKPRKVKALTERAEKAEAALSSLQADNDRLRRELAGATSDLRTLRNVNEKYEARIRELEEQAKTDAAVLKTAVETCAELRTDKLQLEGRIQVLTEDVCSGPCGRCPCKDDFPYCMSDCFNTVTAWSQKKASECNTENQRTS